MQCKSPTERMMLDHPESSNAAYALQSVVMSVIVLSTISAVFETVPSLHQEFSSFFAASEFVFTVLFTVEVLCRMVVSKSCRGYVCSISNQIDIIATMPWYVERIMVHTAPTSDHSHLEKMAGSLRTLRMVRLARMVRLLRVLRLAKVARHSEVISIVLESLVESATGIFVLMSFVSMWALVCATVVYAAEIDAPDTDFVSIPAALWWSMATISTVGYGDMVPHTSLGKLVGGVSMLGGILITSISVAVITTSFTEHYQQRVRVHEVSKFKELARRHSMLENANGEATPDSSTVTRSRQPDVLAAWQELEEEVQKHLVRLEAEILYRPLRTRPSDTHVALEMLKARIRELVVYGGVPLNCDSPLDFAVLRRRSASARTLLALGATLASCSSQVSGLCLRWGVSYEAQLALFAAAQLGDAATCRQLLTIKVDPAKREEVLEWAVLAPVSSDVVVTLLPYADAVAIQSTLRLSLDTLGWFGDVGRELSGARNG
eukprot:s1496_g15.t1